MTTIREERLARGWTQQELAARIGSAVSTVYSWEAGTRVPTVKQLRKLATVFGVLMDDITLLERAIPTGERPRGRPARRAAPDQETE